MQNAATAFKLPPASETIKENEMVQEFINNMPGDFGVSLQGYIWWAKHFMHLEGYVRALDDLGLKEEVIKQQLISCFAGSGLLKVDYFVIEREVLRKGLERLERRRDKNPSIRYFRLILSAYDRFIERFDVLMQSQKISTA